MDFNKTLYLMVGIPGSGKSTWVKEHLKPNQICVSRDQIRFSKLSENDTYFKNERAVEAEYYKQIREALEDNTIEAVYADATQSNENSRHKFLENVFPFGVPENVSICPVVVKTSLMDCLERNAGREGRSYVPESAIKRMYNAFTHPLQDSFKNLYSEYIFV